MQRLIGRKSQKFYPVFEVPLGVTLECYGETDGTDGREYPTIYPILLSVVSSYVPVCRDLIPSILDVLCFNSYNECIVCDFNIKSCLLTSICWRLNRLSAALDRRSAARYPASNHGVAGMALCHIWTIGSAG